MRLYESKNRYRLRDGFFGLKILILNRRELQIHDNGGKKKSVLIRGHPCLKKGNTLNTKQK